MSVAQAVIATFTAVTASPKPKKPKKPTGTVTLGTVKVKGSTLRIAVSCHGTASARCTGTLALTTLEHLTGQKLTAVSASKKTTRTVTLGRATYSLTGGATKTLTITLDSTAKQLLARYARLPAKLTATPTGSTTAAATKTVTI